MSVDGDPALSVSAMENGSKRPDRPPAVTPRSRGMAAAATHRRPLTPGKSPAPDITGTGRGSLPNVAGLVSSVSASRGKLSDDRARHSAEVRILMLFCKEPMMRSVDRKILATTLARCPASLRRTRSSSPIIRFCSGALGRTLRCCRKCSIPWQPGRASPKGGTA